MNRLLSYPSLSGEVVLEVTNVLLDGHALDTHLFSSAQHVIALNEAERPQWEEARITVRLQTPTGLSTDAWTEPSCVVVASERSTNTRSVFPLTRSAENSWTGTLELHHALHREQVAIDGHVVATVQGVSGRIIGSATKAWVVDLQARSPARRNEITYVHVDFSAPENSFLHPFRDSPWTVQATGAEPVLYVNSGFEGLSHLLYSGDRAVRAAVAGEMAADLWTALFNSAVTAVEIDEEGQATWPADWRGSVLRRLLPDIFPDRSPDDALLELVSRRSQHEEGDLQTRLLHAALKQARLSKSLSGLIKMMAKRESA